MDTCRFKCVLTVVACLSVLAACPVLDVEEVWDTTPPGQVRDVRIDVGDSQVTVSWVEPEDDDFSRTSVWFQRSGEETNAYREGPHDSSGTVFRHFTNGVSYNIGLETLDVHGNRSEPVIRSFTPVAEIQTQPTGVLDLAVAVHPQGVNVTWTNPVHDLFSHVEVFYANDHDPAADRMQFDGEVQASGTLITTDADYVLVAVVAIYTDGTELERRETAHRTLAGAYIRDLSVTTDGAGTLVLSWSDPTSPLVQHLLAEVYLYHEDESSESFKSEVVSLGTESHRFEGLIPGAYYKARVGVVLFHRSEHWWRFANATAGTFGPTQDIANGSFETGDPWPDYWTPSIANGSLASHYSLSSSEARTGLRSAHISMNESSGYSWSYPGGVLLDSATDYVFDFYVKVVASADSTRSDAFVDLELYDIDSTPLGGTQREPNASEDGSGWSHYAVRLSPSEIIRNAGSEHSGQSLAVPELRFGDHVSEVYLDDVRLRVLEPIRLLTPASAEFPWMEGESVSVSWDPGNVGGDVLLRSITTGGSHTSIPETYMRVPNDGGPVDLWYAPHFAGEEMLIEISSEFDRTMQDVIGPIQTVPLPEIPTPTVTDISAATTGPRTLRLECDDADADIWYTIDGGSPLSYFAPITLWGQSQVLEVWSARDGYTSDSASHIVKVSYPAPHTVDISTTPGMLIVDVDLDQYANYPEGDRIPRVFTGVFEDGSPDPLFTVEIGSSGYSQLVPGSRDSSFRYEQDWLVRNYVLFTADTGVTYRTPWTSGRPFSLTMDAPSNVQAQRQGDTSVEISWTNALDFARYDIELSVNGGAWSDRHNAGANGFTYTGVSITDEYQVRLRSVGHGGEVSEWVYSNTVGDLAPTESEVRLEISNVNDANDWIDGSRFAAHVYRMGAEGSWVFDHDVEGSVDRVLTWTLEPGEYTFMVFYESSAAIPDVTSWEYWGTSLPVTIESASYRFLFDRSAPYISYTGFYDSQTWTPDEPFSDNRVSASSTATIASDLTLRLLIEDNGDRDGVYRYVETDSLLRSDVDSSTTASFPGLSETFPQTLDAIVTLEASVERPDGSQATYMLDRTAWIPITRALE